MSPQPLLLLGLLLGCAPLSAATAPVIYNVRDTGAVGDGRQLETVAINQSIDACAKAGGGTVYVPPGRYLTGTIVLQSHVTLELDAGATILGSENPDDYPSTKSVWG
jgi:polygalacturonase